MGISTSHLESYRHARLRLTGKFFDGERFLLALGCLPAHGRDPQLIDRLRAEEPLKLVGGGHFLQQPVLADDLADLILSCAGRASTFGRIYHAAGPDVIESRGYYRVIAEAVRDALGAPQRAAVSLAAGSGPPHPTAGREERAR